MSVENFPERLRELIDAGWVHSYPALEIQFSNSTSLNVSTTEMTVDGVDYLPFLVRVNSVKTSLSRSVDRAEIVLDNADLMVGDTLLDDANDSILDNLPAVYHTIYVNIDDPTEVFKITKMSGVVYTFSEDGETELHLTLLSDAYAGGGVAPYDVKRSCVWQYKDGINCDYNGTIPTCDLSFEGANGCVVHFGFDGAKSRYGGGGRDLDESSRNTFTPLNNRPIIGSGCFFGDTPIYTDEDFNTRPIRGLTKGAPVLGFDKQDLIPVADSAADDPFRFNYTSWYHLMFSDGSKLNVTETHPFYPEPGKRVLVKDFKRGMKFRRLVNGKWRTVKLIKRELKFSAFPTPFYNVPVALTQDYYANGFPVSNLKAPREPGEFPPDLPRHV